MGEMSHEQEDFFWVALGKTDATKERPGRPRTESWSTSASSCAQSPCMQPQDRSGVTAFEEMPWDDCFMLAASEADTDDSMSFSREGDPSCFFASLPSPVHKAAKLAAKAEAENESRQEAETMVTPRTASCPEPDSPRTPRTPRTVPLCRSETPPPLVQKFSIPPPPMLKALRMDSLDQVRAVLDRDRDAAQEPFWDHDVEPPLCCAARLGCSASIVKLLLENGASTEAQDVRRRMPHELADEFMFPPATMMADVGRYMMMPPHLECSTMRPGPYEERVTWHGEVSHLLASKRSGA